MGSRLCFFGKGGGRKELCRHCDRISQHVKTKEWALLAATFLLRYSPARGKRPKIMPTFTLGKHILQLRETGKENVGWEGAQKGESVFGGGRNFARIVNIFGRKK